MAKIFSVGASVLGGLFMLLIMSIPARAAITNVYGGSIEYGDGAPSVQTGQIIGNPLNVLDDGTKNDRQQGFNEAQGVLLTEDLLVDGGVIAKGMRVDSHMIFLNSRGLEKIYHYGVQWEFSGTILGVMSDIDGDLEAASSELLGAEDTTYDNGNTNQSAPFRKRGMEADYDGYNILGLGNVLEVDMFVTEPGDWIRVVTVSAVPLPAALPLYGAGIAVLSFLGWRKRRGSA
ncbi:hypothetical protein [Sneathiella limimaris]|uniref:hypothetical protein n=1 Tax=Sneathiella limimaris TaxID=1964213 RepID=UPI00146E82C6|nr:hypothetical protein [Sneathiella limimaris]